MDGMHDRGGMRGFGSATWPGAERVVWHGWDARTFAFAMAGAPGSTHAFRHTIERIGDTCEFLCRCDTGAPSDRTYPWLE